MLIFSLYDQCLISCPFQAPFHLYRIIQVVKFTHIDSVIRTGPVNVCRIFLFQQLIQQPVRIALIAEQSHLHPVDPKLAAACDKGVIELFDGDWLDQAADEIEETLKAEQA